MSFLKPIVSALVFGSITLVMVQIAEAQEPTAEAVAEDRAAVEIDIPDAVLLLPTSVRNADGSIATLGEAIGAVTVFADGEECLTISLTDDSYRTPEGKTVPLGDQSQAPSCRLDGARLTFVDEAGRTLAKELVLRRGETLVLDNFAPVPPDTDTVPPSVGEAGLRDQLTSQTATSRSRVATFALAGAAIGLAVFLTFWVRGREHGR